MDGITVAVVSAVYLSVASSKVVYFNTPYYECKAFCCMRNSCLSFDVVLSSLDCYLNEEANITADEIHSIGSDTTLNEKNTEVQQSAHGSCKKEGETASGCLTNPTFRWIHTSSFEKKDDNPVRDMETTVDQTTKKGSAEVPSSPRPQVCPSTFISQTNTGYCWKVFSQKIRRQDAQRTCSRQATGGRLAILDTQHKYRFVKQLLSRSKHGGCIHIGGKRSATGEFIWLSGAEVVREGWCPGQPRNSNFLSLWPEKRYCLDDIGAFTTCHFVCEVQM